MKNRKILYLTFIVYILNLPPMNTKVILEKIEKFFYFITPPFYLMALMLGFLSVIPFLMTPYVDKASDRYELTIAENEKRMENISKEISSITQANNIYKEILLTNYALSCSNAKRLPSDKRYNMAEVITEQAKLHNIDPLLIVALIQVESNFKDKALSNKGAKGLMQLLPDTAAYIHAKNDKGIKDVSNLFDMETNIKLGTAYMDYLLKKTDGNIEQALTAYNMGPSNMYRAMRKNKMPKKYSNKVLTVYNDLQKKVESLNTAQLM